MTKLETRLRDLKIRTKGALVKSEELSVNRAGELVQLAKRAASEFDKRIIRGYLIVWGVRDSYGTKFLKGCCANSINQRGPNSSANQKITFLWQHRTDDPLSLFAVLEEDDYGLYFETKPLDDVTSANRTITQLRSGTLNGFSAGFNYVWDKAEYDETDDSIVFAEIILREGSVVTIASHEGTFAMRSVEAMADLADETEDFVKSLPNRQQLEARNLFARHKALIDFEEPSTETLRSEEPQDTAIDYNHLLTNLNLFKK